MTQPQPAKVTDYPHGAQCLTCGTVTYWWIVKPIGDRASDGYTQVCVTCGTRRET